MRLPVAPSVPSADWKLGVAGVCDLKALTEWKALCQSQPPPVWKALDACGPGVGSKADSCTANTLWL